MGIGLEEFAEMTPKEFNLFAQVFTEKTEQENHEKIYFAWLGAHWQRVEKLEPFESYINKKEEEKPKQMSMEEMMVKVYELNAKMGGTTVKPGGDD